MDTTTHDETGSSVRLLGGEILTGSDVDGGDRCGDWLLPLIGPALPARGSVLVAGRHDDTLLTALASADRTVDLVLRNLPDARAARTRLAGAGVRVLCGSLDRLSPNGSGYDAVVALDDPELLYGPDSPPRRWTDTVALLAGLAAPGAPVLLSVRNGFGLDRLAFADVPRQSTTPPGLAALRTALSAAGLHGGALLAAYPGLVAESGALATAGTAVAALVADACSHGYPPLDSHTATRDGGPISRDHAASDNDAAPPNGRPISRGHAASDNDAAPPNGGPISRGHAAPNDDAAPRNAATAGIRDGGSVPGNGSGRYALTDPVSLARDAVRHGLGVELAPSWLAVTSRTDTVDGPEIRVPAGMVLADRQSLPYWSVPQYVGFDGTEGWLRTPQGTDTEVRTLAHLTRDPSTVDGPVPVGRSLGEALRAACGEHDLPTIRGLLRRYRDWLCADATHGAWRAVWADDEPGDGQLCAPGKLLPTLDGVLLGPNGLAPVDPSWSSTLRVPVELVLIRALQRFSYRLLTGGYSHPWPAGASPDRLAVTLAAMLDITVSPRDLVAANGFGVHLEAPLAAEAGDTGALRYARLQQRWTAEPGHGAVPPRGYAEAVTTIGALSAELAEARAQIRWLDDTVAERDRRLGDLGALRRSVTYRIGYLCTLPYHIGIRLLRRELRRLRA